MAGPVAGGGVERAPPVSPPGRPRLRLLTFLLIVVGGIVRISDSGLGCGAGGSGTKGWPLCGGRVIPLVDENMIVEYSHRIARGDRRRSLIATLLCWPGAATASDGRLFRGSLAALVLIVWSRQRSAA